MHDNTGELLKKYAKPYFQPNMRVLEVGPGALPSPIQRIVGDASIRWETRESTGSVPLRSSGPNTSFPVESDVADVVIATNVMEHVRKPWVWIKELARICKPAGYVITINPVSWPYREYPIDCWRAYPEGMMALYEDAGLSGYYLALRIAGRCPPEEAHSREVPEKGLSPGGLGNQGFC